ncbi:hypothetical protein BD289DRAFT_467698 [Coniella lustricola]|uniref:Uncharacterized protein n=1 Tax=Coniella lustricola TaxID=2025994 RepID=A0A2T3A653_9PEZI|nr:hypothetical protein BD289DRAFT_467698 [Coniella lustricola]
MLVTNRPAPSAAIFSPQSAAPTSTYLNHIRSRLNQDALLRPLHEAITALPQAWETLAPSKRVLPCFQLASQQTQQLVDWLDETTDRPAAVEAISSAAVTLPLLVTIHIVQYLDYLSQSSIRHAEFLESLQLGGVQGYCVGLLSAITVASAPDENTLLRHAAAAIRAAFAIGVFGMYAEAITSNTWTTLAIRLKQGSEEEERKLVQEFPGAYISTISDQHSRSVIVPSNLTSSVMAYAETQGFYPKTVHIQGRLHNADNASLATECLQWWHSLSAQPFPSGSSLKVPVYSNRTGQDLSTTGETSLDSEVFESILASVSNWAGVMKSLAVRLQEKSTIREHSLALFGIGHAVPLAPFRQHDLDITKLDMLSTTTTPSSMPSSSSTSIPPTPCQQPPGPEHNPDAIAIVGVGCRLPGASSLDELWDLISQGRTRLETLRTDRADISASYRASHHPDSQKWTSKRTFHGNYIDDISSFDHAFFGLSPREAMYMDPQQRLLLATAFDAMDSSGYLRHHKRGSNSDGDGDGDNIGCFIGACYTEYLENTCGYSPSAFTATGTIRAFLSGRISYHFGWTGPSEVIDTACSASLVAVHRACQAIRTGECSQALAGGVNLITGINNYMDLGKASFLSQTGQCKPFDEAADGYCRADGVGLVVLKPLGKALADSDQILGVIEASGTNQGGVHSPGITVPDGVAQRALYRRVLANSGLKAGQVSYVEAHGTGTQVGDPIEIKSIREVFGGAERSTPVHLGSLKANIGHSETAAGVASLIKVLAMLRHQKIPPLQGFRRLNPKIPAIEGDMMRIPTEVRDWDVPGLRAACVNSYGASGSNAALLCTEWKGSERLVHQQQQGLLYPILLSAASAESLCQYAQRLAAHIHKQSSSDAMSLGDLAYTLSERRKHHRVRWSTTATSLVELTKQLQEVAFTDLVDIPAVPKKVVLTFSGQSRTNIGLDPSTRQNYPQFDRHIIECNEILQSLGCPDVLPALADQGVISDPVVLQCGTVAVQYASAKCWLDGGLRVDAVVGHSLGELTALAVSGTLSLADTLKVVYTRAQLIKEKWGSERGTMLAVHAPIDIVQSLMKDVETALDTKTKDEVLEIACLNSATSHILVGKDSTITRAEAILKANITYKPFRSQRLNVSHGFHSRFTEPLLSDLIALEKTLVFHSPSIPLETCTQQPVTPSSLTNSRYIADHARLPVYFSAAIRRLEARLGSCVWLEAGRGSPITSMTKKAVADANSPHHRFQAGSAPAIAAATLWREGIHSTGWSLLAPRLSDLRAIWLPPYCFAASSKRAWLDHVDHAVLEKEAGEAKAAELAKASSPGEMAIALQQARLVTYLGPLRVGHDENDELHRFSLHTATQRFANIVKGHAVRGKPLCPASMYMEAAAMGIDHLGSQLKNKTITVQNVVFQRPLSCGGDGSVQVQLEKKANSYDCHQAGGESWHYSVRDESAATKTKAAAVAYSEGDIMLSNEPHPDLDLYTSLISEGIEALRKDTTAERLGQRSAYSLFSKIVEYSEVMRGITSIAMGENKALAQIEVPQTSPLLLPPHESTVAGVFDAVSLDTFIQPLGLLINCRNSSESADEIYIASSIGKMVVSPTRFDESGSRSWTVYATYQQVAGATDGKALSGSIFVFSRDGNLVSFGTGIQFVRTQAARLERVLEAAISGTTTTSVKRSLPMPCAGHDTSNNDSQNAPVVVSRHAEVVVGPAANESSTSSTSTSSTDSSVQIEALKALVASYAGLKPSEIHDDLSFANIGLDSLASMELAGELESTLGLNVSADDLLLGDFGTLVKTLCPSSSLSSSSSLIPAQFTPTTTTEPSIAMIESLEAASNTSSQASSTCGDLDDALLDSAASSLSVSTAPSSRNGSIDKASDIPTLPSTWTRLSEPLSGRCAVQTVVYKEIDGVEIPADIYIPSEKPPQAMPVALMIHGGGHLTLSRRAVRPAQTKFLLKNGILPVSLDYRLAPHVNVVDGSMADVRDACVWARTELPELMALKGHAVDPTKLVVVGWSTGGTLAMTTSWTLAELGHEPPLAVLSFYCPVDYNPDAPILMGDEHRSRCMSLRQIEKILPPGPVTSHAFNVLDGTKLGWLSEADPRSELVLALIKEPNGMSLLFNDWPFTRHQHASHSVPDIEDQQEDGDNELPPANSARALAFSPMAQVKAGKYKTPTYLVFGEEDEIAPFGRGKEFIAALKETGVACGLLPVKGAKHIYDLGLTPGSKGWESGVGPGFDFILEHIEGAAMGQGS